MINPNPPLISVILPVRNAETFIEECLESVLKQSFRDFECIIVNDGSTDNTAAILGRIKDARIQCYHLNQSGGVPFALNLAITKACGRYLARVDADDRLNPRRFEYQINFMEKNPQVGVLGSWATNFGKHKSVIQTPADHESIACGLLFRGTLLHPTVMIRHAVLQNLKIGYDPEYRYAEDTELWLRLVHQTQFENLTQSLVYRRTHKGMATHVHNRKMYFLVFKLRERLVAELAPNSEEQSGLLEIHRILAGSPDSSFQSWTSWLERLKKAASQSALWSLKQSQAMLVFWRQDVVRQNYLLKKRYHPALFWKYALDSGCPWKYVSPQASVIFFIKCMIFWKARAFV